jgi:hypothetical protein
MCSHSAPGHKALRRLTFLGLRYLQPSLFGLDEALGEGGWLKALKLDEYAPRRSPRPQASQQVLFPYVEAL